MNSDLYDLYQDLILDHNRRPRNQRSMEGADSRAEGFNPLCGDRITVYLKVENGVVVEATFEGSGCAISTASASLMTEAVKGKTVAEAKALFDQFRGLVTGDNGDQERNEGEEDAPSLGKLAVFSGVGRYPARVKCATLAWHTVKAALDNSDGVISTE